MEKLTVKYKGHFFASSAAEWRTGEDYGKLVRSMIAGGFPFQVIWVPLPAKAEYHISDYVPEVEGCVMIATYGI